MLMGESGFSTHWHTRYLGGNPRSDNVVREITLSALIGGDRWIGCGSL